MSLARQLDLEHRTVVACRPDGDAPAVSPDDLARDVDLMGEALPSYEVVATTDPKYACKLLSEGERYDVILCDFAMPKVSGAQVHQYIVEHCPEQAGRLIFMTGIDRSYIHDRFPNLVMVAHLFKPFAIETVEALVRKMGRR